MVHSHNEDVEKPLSNSLRVLLQSKLDNPAYEVKELSVSHLRLARSIYFSY